MPVNNLLEHRLEKAAQRIEAGFARLMETRSEMKELLLNLEPSTQEFVDAQELIKTIDLFLGE